MRGQTEMKAQAEMRMKESADVIWFIVCEMQKRYLHSSCQECVITAQAVQACRSGSTTNKSGIRVAPWAAQYDTGLLIKLTPNGVVFSFFFFLFCFIRVVE